MFHIHRHIFRRSLLRTADFGFGLGFGSFYALGFCNFGPLPGLIFDSKVCVCIGLFGFDRPQEVYS